MALLAPVLRGVDEQLVERGEGGLRSMARISLAMAAGWTRLEDDGCEMGSKFIPSIADGIDIHHNPIFGRDTLISRRP